MVADLISGERRLAGPDLLRRARQASGGLKGMGLAPGDVVAVLMRNDFPFVEVALAAEQVGLAMVPLNWHGSVDEIGFVLADCGARVLFAHADLLARIEGRQPPGCTPIAVAVPPEIAAAYRIADGAARAPAGIEEYEAWLARAPLDNAPPTPPPFRLSYTSGSTGQPKGVVRRRGSDAEAARAARIARETHGTSVAGCRAVMTAPLYHSAPLAYGMMYVRHGSLLVLQTRFDASELLRLAERHRLTHFYAVATMFGRLLALPSAERDRFDLSSLRSVVHGAAMCPPAVKRAMIDWWGPIISECYAATETALIATCTSPEWLARPGTVGRAAEGVELRIVDEEGRTLPPGEEGEILIRSAAAAAATYLHRPDAMAELRRGDWATMGDVGWMDADGYLWITDRKKDMVNCGGVNIYPAELERVMLAWPEVRDAIVFGVPDDDLGEALVAMVERQPGVALTEGEARARLGEALGRLRVPKVVAFVERLPREATGKLARRTVRAAYLVSAAA